MKRFEQIRYSLPIWTDSTPASAFERAALGGVREATGLLEAVIEDLDDDVQADPSAGQPSGEDSAPPSVFVVHGRNEAVRERVARFLERLSLAPIILQERTDQGRTIIEKFEANALDVTYAVVLLTPDDFGRGPEDADWRKFQTARGKTSF
jgi:predicted nucleotide-binding protein